MMSIWDLADSRGNVRVKDVAAEAGVDARTVYKWVECGLLRCRRLPRSGRLMFKATDVEAFMVSLTGQSDTSRHIS
jgi:predicted site-specific integrase-resolvase